MSRRPRTQEWADGARDVVAQGYKVLKTNLIQEAADGRKRAASDVPRRRHRPATMDEAVDWIGTLRDVVGPDIGISVDVQFDYRMGGIVQLARAMEPFDLYWLEVEDLDPDALLAARAADADPRSATASRSSGATSSGRSSRTT